jgi:hypothetical protein
MLFLLSRLAGELLVQLDSADCGGEKEGVASESQTASRRKQEGKVKLDRLGSRIQDGILTLIEDHMEGTGLALRAQRKLAQVSQISSRLFNCL